MIEPGIAMAVACGNRRIGVIGGRRTIESGIFGSRLRALGLDVRCRIAQPLSALVEAGELSGARVRAAVAAVLGPYTTLYREGGAQFAKVAETLARQKRQAGRTVLCRAVECKQDFIDLFGEFTDRGATIAELHFVGHSGVYGIMLGTRSWPEQ